MSDEYGIKPTAKALRDCAQWLSQCLKLGWAKETLDKLEALWWQYHKPNGDLRHDQD